MASFWSVFERFFTEKGLGGGLQFRGKWGSLLSKNVLIVFSFFLHAIGLETRRRVFLMFLSILFFVFVVFCVVCKHKVLRNARKFLVRGVGLTKMVEYGVGVCGQTDDLIR